MNKELIVRKLQEIVSKKNVITNQNDLDKFNNDWRGYYNFKSICAVLPENVNYMYAAPIRSSLKNENLGILTL